MYQDAGSGAAAPQKKSGCWKWGCIGCGGLTVIILILVVVIGGYALKQASSSISEFMSDPKGAMIKLASTPIKKAMLDALPEGVEPADVEEASEAFWAAIMSGDVDNSVGEELGQKFQSAFQDGVLTPEETGDLLEFMREVGGLEADDPAAEEVPDVPEEGWEEDAPAEAAATEI